MKKKSTLESRLLAGKQKGSVAAEMAIALPLFFFILMGLVDLGRGVAARATIGHIAREAARWASVRGSDSPEPATASSIQTWARARVEGLDPNDMNVNAVWTPTNDRGGTVEVLVNYTFRPVVPWMPFNSINLSTSSETTILN